MNETRGTEALLACQLLHVLGVGLPGPGESVGLGVRHLDLHHQLLSKPGHWDWLSRALGPCQQAEG